MDFDKLVGRIVISGTAITGFLGIILALNASLADEYVGAGVLLIASALAFGLLGLSALRR